MRKAEVISYLANCTYQEFMSTLRQVLPYRVENGIREVPGFGAPQLEDARLVLCLMTRTTRNRDPKRAKRLVWNRWRVGSLLAYPDPHYSDDSDVAGGWPREQSGQCARCRVRFEAATKGGVCPLCGRDVPLT